MSMIRDLRAVVRPALRRGAGPYEPAASRPGPSAVVDCAVYSGGRRAG
ncbi:magnesium transporter CorA, partial [Streptomyces sp. DJ]